MKNNIQEDYCSFEVSKLLAEKGFEIHTSSAYSRKGKLISNLSHSYLSDGHYIYVGQSMMKIKDYMDEFHGGEQKLYYITTHAVAIKWIRENFNWNVEAGYRIIQKDYRGAVYPLNPSGEIHLTGVFKTNEEATEAALLYALNNLI
jgi:hypothetical protein